MAIFPMRKEPRLDPTPERDGGLLSEDEARALVDSWRLAEDCDADFDAAFLRQVQRQCVAYDPQSRTMSVRLREALRLENGDSLEVLTLRRITAGELKQAQKGRLNSDRAGAVAVDIEIVYRLISTVTGVPLGVIDRLDSRDLATLAAALSFFQ